MVTPLLHPGNNGCLLQNYDCYKHDCLPVPVGAETARCIEVTTLLFRLDGYMSRGGTGALGYFLGGYVPPGTPNWHPVPKKISPKIDTPF